MLILYLYSVLWFECIELMMLPLAEQIVAQRPVQVSHDKSMLAEAGRVSTHYSKFYFFGRVDI